MPRVIIGVSLFFVGGIFALACALAWLTKQFVGMWTALGVAMIFVGLFLVELIERF